MKKHNSWLFLIAFSLITSCSNFKKFDNEFILSKDNLTSGAKDAGRDISMGKIVFVISDELYDNKKFLSSFRKSTPKNVTIKKYSDFPPGVNIYNDYIDGYSNAMIGAMASIYGESNVFNWYEKAREQANIPVQLPTTYP